MARTKNCKLSYKQTKFLRFQDFTSAMRSKNMEKIYIKIYFNLDEFYRGIIAIGVRNWICGVSDKVE